MSNTLNSQDNQNVLGQEVRILPQDQPAPVVGVQQQPTKGLKLNPAREQPGFGLPVRQAGSLASFSPIRQGQVPVSQGRVTVEEGDEFEKNKKNRGLLKLGLFLLILAFLGIG